MIQLSKETEAEIREVYQAYWNAYLTGDFETFGSYLDDHVMIYGTAAGEIFSNKEDALKFYIATGEEMTGKAEFRNRNIRIQPFGDAIAIYEQSQLFIRIEDTWTFYGSARLTGILEKKGGHWKIVHQHGSFPDSRTGEGQQIASDQIRAENLQLREAVYRRTVELENKTHELEIESALEKVRTEAMAMRQRDDMLSVCESIAKQLERLQVPHIRNVQTAIVSESQHGYYLNYQFFLPYQKGIIECVEIAKHPSVEAMIRKMQASPEAYFPAAFKGKELDEWRHYRNADHQFPDPILEQSDAVYFHFYSIGQGGLGISTYEELNTEHLHLFYRFRNVFALAYQRFRDIEKAEAQAREAQIEAALERVRARTMAMQHSDELTETSVELYRQLTLLGEPAQQMTIGIINEAEGVVEISATLQGTKLKQTFHHPISEPYFMQKAYNAWKARKKIFIHEMRRDDLIAYNHIRNQIVGENLFPVDLAPDSHRHIAVAFFSKGILGLATDEPRPAASIELLERFASVFDLTYTRFLDLQKAEAQAREARIESSLEKVRSVAMSMRKPEDLLQVCEQLYKECEALGLTYIRNAMINIHDDENRTFVNYDFSPELRASITPLTFDIHPVIEKQIRQVRSANDAFSETSFTGEELQEWKAFRKARGEQDDPRIHDLKGLYYYLYSIGTGSIGISTFEPATDEHVNLLKRFRNVFALAYQRYTEIIFAESQAREAQIEAALERVRSRSMAMHQSDELREVIQVVFDQMLLLNIPVEHTGFIIDYATREDMHIWLTDKLFSPFQITIPYFDSPHWNSFVEAKQKGDSFFTNLLDFETKNKFYTDLFKQIPPLPEASREAILAKQGLAISTVLLDTVGLYIENFSGIPFTEEANTILKRFGNVFQQSYTRFLDLQKSEAQTQKAKIEVALERVRARALAMQEPEELVEVAEVMRHEMGLLGIEELETSSIYIHDEGTDIADCWYAIKDNKVPEKKLVADHIHMQLHHTWVGRQMLDFFNSNQQQTSIVMQGANRIEWINYCSSISDVLVGFYGEVIPDRTYHLYKFSNGAIGAASEGDISEESWELLRRATSVFSLAYSRFRDLTQARVDLQRLKSEKQRAEEALAHLKAAQAQLIQSEKMASLGELTAGIAHEIQNPLNFVNNFSEVSRELVDEMKEELDKGNLDDAQAIAGDLQQNLEKINHHGKRADAIVKGMLQHSRTSSGVKEPTDINALADEYLRLAYHGLRAKDKTFNATMKTDFDPSIGRINVIPQDIGRVILNLITNAFHAVSAPKSPKGDLAHNPTVTVKTFLLKPPLGGLGATQVEISVSDNGPGIPEAIKDKIFQPFFTTKPTGQGTGLGLSLSYDIIKAHGGEIKVETKENEGTTFTIQLPS